MSQSSVISRRVLVARGRTFTRREIALIKRVVTKLYVEGRTRISVEICTLLNWRQPNGWLKDRACRDVLVELERRGILALPPPKSVNGNANRRYEPDELFAATDETPISVIAFSGLRIVNVKGTQQERLWNQLVAAHHYLGFSVSVGRTLKYLVFSSTRIVAAFAFADPAWAVRPRDEILARAGITSRETLISNSRFLVMPWVRVPNLASHLLALIAKRVQHDWMRYYSIRPQLIETYVDSSRFRGTSYRAANWIHIGLTGGYAKRGKTHHNGQTKKDIFLLPLTARIRVKLHNAIGSANGIPQRRTNR